MKVTSFRQGDVMILKVKNRVEEGFKKADHLTLALGETTGHSHRITEGQAELYLNPVGNMFLSVLTDQATLYHEEHEEIQLFRGDYEIVIQKEWDWFNKMARKVVD